MHDEPQEPPAPRPGLGDPGFEAPHPNGAVHHAEAPVRKHPPWEFLILLLLVALLGIGMYVGWTVWGSRSPERLDDASATALAAACANTRANLKALPNPNPRLGADRVARVRAENVELRAMVAKFATVHPVESAPAAALQGWAVDWGRMIDARATYADALENAAGTDNKVRFIYPAENAIKPITNRMDDFVRENHPRLDACFTEALQLEVFEGQREYEKVTK